MRTMRATRIPEPPLRLGIITELDRVQVLCEGRVVADHARCWALHQSRTDPGHTQAAKAMRHDRFSVVTQPAVTEVEQRDLSHYDSAFGLTQDVV